MIMRKIRCLMISCRLFHKPNFPQSWHSPTGNTPCSHFCCRRTNSSWRSSWETCMASCNAWLAPWVIRWRPKSHHGVHGASPNKRIRYGLVADRVHCKTRKEWSRMALFEVLDQQVWRNAHHCRWWQHQRSPLSTWTSNVCLNCPSGL